MECELPQFWNVTEPVARKQYSCCECSAPILAGEKYVRCSGKWDFDPPKSFKQHLLCANACRWVRDNILEECLSMGGLQEWWGEDGYYGDKKRPEFIGIRKMLAGIYRRERAK